MPYYGLDTVSIERIFAVGALISGMNFGLLSALYVGAWVWIWIFWNRGIGNGNGGKRISTTFLGIYITIPFITLFVSSAVSAGVIEEMYTDDNRNWGWSYPGSGSSSWRRGDFLAVQSWVINGIWVVAYFFLVSLADFGSGSLVTWRSIIREASSARWIPLFLVPWFMVLLLLISYGIGAVLVLLGLFSERPDTTSLDFHSKILPAFGVAYYALSIGMNVVFTILITRKLLSYRHRIKNSSSSLAAVFTTDSDVEKFYRSLLRMFVESTGLYSTFTICALISYGVDGGSVNDVCGNLTATAQQISAYLVVYRLVLGSAWQTDAMEKKKKQKIEGPRNESNDDDSSHLLGEVKSTYHAKDLRENVSAV